MWGKLCIRGRRRSDQTRFANTDDRAPHNSRTRIDTHISTQSIVNHIESTAHSSGGNVFINNQVNNCVLMQKQVRTAELKRRLSTAHKVSGGGHEDDKVKYVVFAPKYLTLTLLSTWGQLRIRGGRL